MTDGPSPYAGTVPVASLAHVDGGVTLVEGTSFALSGRAGDMHGDYPHGLFVRDTRVLSRWEMMVDGHPVEPLTVEVLEPFAARFVARGSPAAGRADADLLVFRSRHVSRGMREVIDITNHGLEPVSATIELRCGADFADLFAVKESRVHRHGHHSGGAERSALDFVHHGRRITKRSRVTFSIEADEADAGRASWSTTLEPGATWHLCVTVTSSFDDTVVSPRFTCDGDDETALPVRRLDEWRARFPDIRTDHPALTATLARSEVDLGALRIFDPDHPEVPILAAGAPWFMTVFGRDSLLTAWMALLADTTLAEGVLRTLARFQGTTTDPETEEAPGKILHEMRFGDTPLLGLGGGQVYYGSVDATPLFVMLLGELHRWRPNRDVLAELLPHADRALEWIERDGDRDGDGYVEYVRSTEHGLANQGWKDSWDAVRFADGALAEPPIALCEVQAYVYGAYRARSEIAAELGDHDGADHWADRASTLRRRFHEDFWLERDGTFALGLDAEKRPIDAVTSNPGHCLWAGIVEPPQAARLADRLLADDLFSGFGIRTLSSSMAAFNPVSYHNGSVWPHDNAICAAGLARYGFIDHARRVIAAQLDVAAALDGALPELLAGFDRAELSVPASYPTSCQPQAWAAASPLLWLRTLLRLDPWASVGRVWVGPGLLPTMRHLRLSGLPIGATSLSIDVVDGAVRTTDTGDLVVVLHPRPPDGPEGDPSPRPAR